MAIADRDVYRTDGRVPAARLPILISGSAMVVILLGFLLYVCQLIGFYLIMIVPLMAAMLSGFLLGQIIGWSKCRNIALATFLGMVVGAAGHLSYYHFCMLHEFGPMGLFLIHRVDFLPTYIQVRLENDVVQDAGARPAAPQAKAHAIVNTVLFAVEFLLSTTIVGFSARLRAMRAFSAVSDQWMNKESISFGPGSGPLLVEAIEQDSLVEALPFVPRASEFAKDTHLILEYSSDGSPFDEPVYLTIAEYGPFKLRSMGTNRYYLVRQIELTTKETLQLAPLFPKLSQLLVEHHEELEEVTLQSPLENYVPSNTTDVAIIEPVGEEYRNRVRTKHYAILVNLIDLSPLVVMFAGFGMAILGGSLMSQGPWGMVAVPLIGVGVVAGIWGIYFGGFQPCLMSNKWAKRKLVQAVSERPDAWIDLNADDLTYFSLIPRENLSKIVLVLSTDLMLGQLDERQGTLVMEGDTNRYQIPVGAISICEPELFYMPLDAQKNVPIWTIRLVVSMPRGSRELLLSMNPCKMEWRAARKRELRVREWCERILGIRNSHLGGTISDRKQVDG